MNATKSAWSEAFENANYLRGFATVRFNGGNHIFGTAIVQEAIVARDPRGKFPESVVRNCVR